MATNQQTYLLLSYLQQNREYDSLIIEKEAITFDGKTINLEGFDVEKFINESGRLINDIPNLPMKDVFNVIKIHVDYANMIKKFEEQKAQEMMDNYISNNPSLSNFHIFKNIDALGFDKSFLKYTDNAGNNYVLQDVSAKEFLATYMEIKDNGMEVTEENLFRSLVSKYKQIKLENRLEAEKRLDVSEEHLNNLKELEEKNNEHMENHSVVVGNEEFGIYINNGNVITMGYNKMGEKVIENHTSSNVNGNEEELDEDLVCKYDAKQLISFDEYKSIITNSESLSNDDRIKIDNFENFLFSIMTYKDYLTPELYQVYDNFEKLWNYLESVKETTMVIEDAKYRYRDMQERSEQIQIVNAKKQVTVLERQLDHSTNYGYVNALLYVGAVIFIGIVIAVITVLAK